MTTSRVLLGVDAGNSKTHVAVAELDGRVRAVVAGPGASPQLLGVEGSWRSSHG